MQLSRLADCEVSLKIFWKEDGSLAEYSSNENQVLDYTDKHSKSVKQHTKFLNKDYNFCEDLEQVIVKHGHLFSQGEALPKKLYEELEGFNMV